MRKFLEQIRKINAGCIWLTGAIVFLPSFVYWVYFIWTVVLTPEVSLKIDWYFFRVLYLPLLAAILGLSIPILFLIKIKKIAEKKSVQLFGIYAFGMVLWGCLDIKNENCQIRGHDYPNSVLTDGHKYYWHVYLTWYFLPYRSIQNYKFD